MLLPHAARQHTYPDYHLRSFSRPLTIVVSPYFDPGPLGLMQDVLRQLSSTVVLAALVAIFLALQYRHSSRRLRLWLIGWGLIFLHFIAGLLPLGPGTLRWVVFVELATLQLAGIMFLNSVAAFGNLRGAARFLGHYYAVLLTMFSALMAWDVRSTWPYLACLAPFFYAGGIFGFLRHLPRGKAWLAVPISSATFGTWALYRVARGDAQFGFYAALLLSYSITAMLFWRRYPRFTPGVVATCGGFIAWSSLFAMVLFAPHFADRIGRQNQIWDVPEFIVAVGMILVLLEDESQALQTAREREQAATLQIRSFAEVTSRLLSGTDVNALCGHIAEVITQTTIFERVLISLVDSNRQFRVVGHAGLANDALAALREIAKRTSVGMLAELCRQGRAAGKIAVICTAQCRQVAVTSKRDYADDRTWHDGDELIVPLRSPRGVMVGYISLDNPRDAARVTADEISKIEMLAADIAVAADHAALQRQLLTTEKLAGLGQLVGGFAHELNNPLTAVLGYSELLADRAEDDESKRGLAIIQREGVRMKRIIENLLRFAQKEATDRKKIELLPILQEVVRQKAYEAGNHGIQVVEDFAASLPRVTADENQIRQVLFNVLNNAIEAVDKAEVKRITVSARAEEDRIAIHFMDTGRGFSDVNRIFDPFFTTKSPGKGTGLGLSICYGVLRQHGGSISARNLETGGACITLELPAAKEDAATASV